MDINEELLDFLYRSPTAFHAVDSACAVLEEAGFIRLREAEAWHIEKGGRYFITRNGSSILAFHIGDFQGSGAFRIAASHSDSPMFKLKAEPELKGPEPYLRLNVEAYGGMIDSTWLDRPLAIAGRIFVRSGEQVESRLFATENDAVLIPNLAIHFNREVNSGYAFNRQVDLCPLFSAGKLESGDFNRKIAEASGAKPEDLLAKDLYVVNRQKGCVWGLEREFVSSPRLDNLQCAFTTLKGFLSAEHPHGINVWCCFDNEEVGSGTQQGALSTFLKDCLTRIYTGLGFGEEQLHQAIAASFLLSADNAHAIHPNHPEKTDAENRCFLNRGLVIKENAAQKYTTDAMSRAVIEEICRRAGEPFQHFANRSDMQGGSTLGNLSNIQVSLHAADVGLPQLAMHSSYETAGADDTQSAVNVFSEYYRADIQLNESDGFIIQ
jgi:aspartyl aminopeptidase